jgi:hypothetical protein
MGWANIPDVGDYDPDDITHLVNRSTWDKIDELGDLLTREIEGIEQWASCVSDRGIPALKGPIPEALVEEDKPYLRVLKACRQAYEEAVAKEVGSGVG